MSLTVPAPTRSLRLRLRDETQDRHRLAEEAVDNLGAFSNVAVYRTWLRCALDLQQHTVSLGDAGAQHMGLAPIGDQLLRALRLDLAESGQAPLDAVDSPRDGESSESPPSHEPGGIERAVGVAYVTEGSALGARVLLERVDHAGIGESRFLRLSVAQSGARWPMVLRALDGFGADENFDAQRCVDEANGVFLHFVESIARASR